MNSTTSRDNEGRAGRGYITGHRPEFLRAPCSCSPTPFTWSEHDLMTLRAELHHRSPSRILPCPVLLLSHTIYVVGTRPHDIAAELHHRSPSRILPCPMLLLSRTIYVVGTRPHDIASRVTSPVNGQYPSVPRLHHRSLFRILPCPVLLLSRTIYVVGTRPHDIASRVTSPVNGQYPSVPRLHHRSLFRILPCPVLLLSYTIYVVGTRPHDIAGRVTSPITVQDSSVPRALALPHHLRGRNTTSWHCGQGYITGYRPGFFRAPCSCSPTPFTWSEHNLMTLRAELHHRSPSSILPCPVLLLSHTIYVVGTRPHDIGCNRCHIIHNEFLMNCPQEKLQLKNDLEQAANQQRADTDRKSRQRSTLSDCSVISRRLAAEKEVKRFTALFRCRSVESI
ncbi:hypothetical protein J6590_073996 [Homalodisca vitripennis]|nr:hypothetical protein J6590_073996 [Homalodisca vitripennis]